MKKSIIILSLSFFVLAIINISAQTYTEGSAFHRVYYRDNQPTQNSVYTHFSVFSAGNAIYAYVGGYVAGTNYMQFFMGTSGVNNPRVATIYHAFDLTQAHTHSHGY